MKARTLVVSMEMVTGIHVRTIKEYLKRLFPGEVQQIQINVIKDSKTRKGNSMK